MSGSPSLSHMKRGRGGLRRILPALLLVELMLTLTAWPGMQAAQATGPSGSMKQYGFSECSVSSCDLALASSVASGDILVVAVGDYSGTAASPADTLGTSFTTVGPVQVLVSGHSGNLYLYYGAAPSAGADTVSITLSGTVSFTDIFFVEVSGADVSSPGPGMGSGSSSTFQTTSVSFTSEGFLIAFVLSDGMEQTVNPSFTSGFTSLLAPSYGSTYDTWGEYSTGSVASPTSFTITPASSYNFAEVGIAFNQPAIPDLPLGVFPLLLVVPILYYLGRRWRSPSTNGSVGPTSGRRQSGVERSSVQIRPTPQRHSAQVVIFPQTLHFSNE